MFSGSNVPTSLNKPKGPVPKKKKIL